ncbi:MAG TPA: bifunctional Gfo/Idh/MocA family oxidoreductase/class I SAM-dependent methyltransferase [Methylomusa anaerophila]|uniref:Polyketide synthase PksR n=1 Tax=Methylomusa anaerophila TaxID=1930071 RepID=A0A348AM44_9FIRM|nr:bifunctional Gfo/Idh/MocA family oxidoreductase/class I SAM-dependent methyltransferase [Methylomusa anaerophila]BBB92142.1 polyketide synthase PksR [Methylomusa anaerophila]HML87844.1 bifunctional Gfo/Idh/MocA family oxidoreductase/class I SAM-dependent methyltransferase [Methylomusa anaerophila]
MKENRGLRTVVCGSRFGQFYLEALKLLPQQFEVAGLLAKGSERSKKCAQRYGINLYTEVDQLPDNIDFACVVLRSGVMGGDGTQLSLKLLARGIHVMQEQPVHHKDLAVCLRTARQNGVHFLTGDLYVHLPAVRRFIACARVMLEQQAALYIDAACATQVSFPMMHILLEALPAIRPWRISNVIKDEGPFQVLTGTIGRIPITLRAHNEVDPADADNHLHLLHRLTIGVEGGSLSLTDTHGPVIWQPRLHVPVQDDIPGGLSTATPVHLLENSAYILGTAVPISYKEILMEQWPRAIGRDLTAMRGMIQGNAVMDTRAQQELLCSRQWQELTNALGYPVLRTSRGHQPLAVNILKEAAAKIAEDSEEYSGQVSRPKTGSAVFACTEYAEDEVQGIDAGQVKACVERLDEAALSSMLFALQAQGTLTVTGREYSEAEILSAPKVAPRHQPLILRWLQILAERGYLTKHGRDFLCTDLITLARVHQCWELVKEAWNGKLGSQRIIDYLIANAEQLPQLISDKQQAALILFPEGRMDVANSLYRDTVMARYLNKSAAEAVIRIAAGKQASSNASPEDSLRILEIGAGTGATTDAVVHRLKTAVSERLKPDYLFTDISNFFLAQARERFKDCPWMRFQIVDIDKNLIEQGVKPASTDIVIAAGMLNNARDTDKTVQGLMQSLVPGGWMLITEPTREFLEMIISQAFMMTRPEDDRKNTKTTFMSVKQWLAVFHQAGGQEVAALPDEGHPLAPLGQKLFVVRKGV